MKYLTSIVCLLAFCSMLLAQPKQQVNTQQQQLLLQAQQNKPKAPIPYLLKKDFEDNLEVLNAKLNAISGNITAVKKTTNNKDAQIASLDKKLKSIEGVLNSTNFKIATTSDSLSKTRFSVEELQKDMDAKLLVAQNEQKAQAKIFWIVLAILIFLSIALPSFIYSVYSIKLAKLKKGYDAKLYDLTTLVNDNYERSIADLKTENKNTQLYVDRYVNALKNDTTTKVEQLSKLVNAELTVINQELVQQKEVLTGFTSTHADAKPVLV